MNKKQVLKVVVPFLIIVAVAGIWFTKNKTTNDLSVTNSDFALHATADFDLEKLKDYGLPILIDFGAEYCPACREMKPVLEKVNGELQEKAIIKYVDIEKFAEIARNYPVRVIPTQVFFDKEGKPFVPSDPEAMGMIMYYSKETNEHLFTVHEGYMSEEMILEVFKEMGLEYDQ